jgi:hypothetical protein
MKNILTLIARWFGVVLLGIGAGICGIAILFFMAIFMIKEWFVEQKRQNRIKVFVERRSYYTNQVIRSPNLSNPLLWVDKKKKMSFATFMNTIGNKAPTLAKPIKEVQSEEPLIQTPAPVAIPSLKRMEPFVVDLMDKPIESFSQSNVISSLTNVKPYYLSHGFNIKTIIPF